MATILVFGRFGTSLGWCWDGFDPVWGACWAGFGSVVAVFGPESKISVPRGWFWAGFGPVLAGCGPVLAGCAGVGRC